MRLGGALEPQFDGGIFTGTTPPVPPVKRSDEYKEYAAANAAICRGCEHYASENMYCRELFKMCGCANPAEGARRKTLKAQGFGVCPHSRFPKYASGADSDELRQ